MHSIRCGGRLFSREGKRLFWSLENNNLYITKSGTLRDTNNISLNTLLNVLQNVLEAKKEKCRIEILSTFRPVLVEFIFKFLSSFTHLSRSKGLRNCFFRYHRSWVQTRQQLFELPVWMKKNCRMPTMWKCSQSQKQLGAVTESNFGSTKLEDLLLENQDPGSP